MTRPSPLKVYRAPGDGRRFRWGDRPARVTVKLSAVDHGFEAFSISRIDIDPGASADFFALRRGDRTFYCLAGNGEVILDGVGHPIGPSYFVQSSAGTSVTFVAGSAPFALFLVTAPHGPETREDLLRRGDAGEMTFPLDPATRREAGLLDRADAAAIRSSEAAARVIAPDEGASYWQADPSGGYLAAKVGPRLFPGLAYSVATQLLDPAARVREHAHRDEHEALISVAGEGVIRLDGEDLPFPVGTVAVVGPRLFHCFRNTGVGPFVAMGVFSPSGIEEALSITGVPRTPGEPRPMNIRRDAASERMLVERFGFIIPGVAAATVGGV